MEKKNVRLLLLVLSLLLLFSLFGCGSKDAQVVEDSASTKDTADSSAEEEDVAADAVDSQTDKEDKSVLKIGTTYGIATLNPYLTTTDGDGYILRQIMEPLVSGEIGSYEPLLAESWEIVDDLTWDFKLREDAFWQEGNPVYEEGSNVNVMAEDVKAVFDFVMDPENEASYQASFSETIKSVEVLDDYTVRFVTHEPSAWLLTVINRIPIFSLKAIEELGVDGFSDYPIGTGPFKFVEYRPDDRVILEKNDKYYIEPNLDEVVFLIIPEGSVSAVALQTGEIDISLQVPPTEVDLMADYDHIDVVPVTMGIHRYIALNCGNPILEDIRVREAISQALNMEEITAAIFDNPALAHAAYCPVVPGIPGYREDFKELWKYDVEGAKSLLAEAGWTAGSDGILEKDGEKMSLIIKTAPDAQRSKLGIIMATELKKIGIDAVAQSLEWATLSEDGDTGNYDIMVIGGYGGIDGLYQMFHSEKGGGPELNYHNEEVNELLDKAKLTVHVEERTKILEEATKLIVLDRPHITAYMEYWQVGVNKRVKDFTPANAYLPLTSPYRNVSID